jgi:uncharacterized protein Yka (UPF0111/DUF47 family)
MTTKSDIVERLGETDVLIPDLIAAGLVANDRAKLRLTMLQEGLGFAEKPGGLPRDFSAERRAAALDGTGFDMTVRGARLIDADRFVVPGAEQLVSGLYEDLDTMIKPLSASREKAQFAARLTALREAAPRTSADIIARSDVAALSQARRGGADSVHLLVMDLHKALNQLAAATAVENVGGARVLRLQPGDRTRVAAFMTGLCRTAPLAFGHPGLGTTATRSGDRLVIQNDIGVTDAHVLVVHIDDLQVTITYTDVHRLRTKFFISLFVGRDVEWSPLTEERAQGLGEQGMFLLVTGRHQARDETALLSYLEFLGSRIVFIIDWNKGRKALQNFVKRKPAIDILGWAAAHDLGHRAFLELGGAALLFEAIRRVAATRVPYGARLDSVLGTAATVEFLERVLQITSEGLSTGRSRRLISDEIQAGLTQCFETAETAFFTIILRHLGVTRMLADALQQNLSDGGLATGAERHAMAERARRLEHKGDQLTIEAREQAGRLTNGHGRLRPFADAVEDATDSLDEAAFLLTLLLSSPPPADFLKPLADIANIATGCVGELVRSVEAAAHRPNDVRADATQALQCIDAVVGGERRADDAQRAAIAAIVGEPREGNLIFIAVELARALETSTDHLARAALALRERVLEELSA